MQKLKLFVLFISSFAFYSCCKEVDVPYEENEETEVELTYLMGESTWKRVDGLSLFNESPKLITQTELTNTSEHNGVFTLKKVYETTQDELIEFEDSKFIKAGETVIFDFERELQPYVTIKDSKTDITIVAPTKKIVRKVLKYKKCSSCDEDCFNTYTPDSTAAE